MPKPNQSDGRKCLQVWYEDGTKENIVFDKPLAGNSLSRRRPHRPSSPTVELGPESRQCIDGLADAIRHAAGSDLVQPAASSPQGESDVEPPATEAYAKEQDLKRVLAELAEVKELITAEKGEVIREAYTVKEVAMKTGLADCTIRQACNKGRIKEAYKARDGSWRIPHESLVDIQSNGLAAE